MLDDMDSLLRETFQYGCCNYGNFHFWGKILRKKNDTKNNELYLKYKAMADQEDNIVFGGRLAEYKYYDMAPIIEQVMKMKNKI